MKQAIQNISMLPVKIVACCSIILLTLSGCKKYLDVPLPINSISGSSVFDNDLTSAGALNSIYTGLYSQSNFDGNGSVSFFMGLYGDEFRNHSTLPSTIAVYANGVSATLGGVTAQWSSLYKQLYSINLAIEGLNRATNLTYKNQWLGEAYFLRGLCYFYLTNMYGAVPLVLGSDYMHNNGLARSPQADVYRQIISDLQQAQSLLGTQYHDGSGLVTTGRARPNRASATALLARVYLYTQNWANAIAQADNVIADAATYQLPVPAQAFVVNSKEIIWGIVPTAQGLYPHRAKDAVIYFLPNGVAPISVGVAASLNNELVNAFESGDLRYTNWVGIDNVPASGSTPAATYYFNYKYKVNSNITAAQESVVMLRLAEQYLIRAEARAQQNNTSGALADLNAVRSRAGLGASTAVTQADVLTAIQKERRIEFFAEGGHRFFDLRRTGTLDARMTTVAPQKGGSWAAFKAWWPIPLSDIESNPRLEQTPGYQ